MIQGLRTLLAQGRLPFKAEPAQDRRHPRRLSGGAARPSAEALKERGEPAALPAPFLAIRGFPRGDKDPARAAAPRRAARPWKHEYPILPDGRRDQPEAVCGRFRRAIACLRHGSSARQARFRPLGAMGRWIHRPAPDSPDVIRRSPDGTQLSPGLRFAKNLGRN